MASVIDVCNRALDKLGQDPITSLDDGNKSANLCKRTWPIIRDRALRAYPWNFAVKRVATAPSTETPSWGFKYNHPIPTDFLRLIEIRDLRSTDYQVEGNNISAYDSVLYIRYIYRVEDPNQYDSLFISAVAALLAAEMSESFTQSNPKAQKAWGEYDAAMMEARRADAQENPVVLIEEDSWINARY